MSTIKDVAVRAGVGVGTVSRVINEDMAVSDSTREKVLAAIKDLSFSPNSTASKLRRAETKIIALMIPVIDHPYFAKLANAVAAAADERGYSIMIVNSQQRIEKEKEIFNQIRRKEVDGAIIVTHFSFSESDIVGCPVVSLDRHVGSDIPYVTTDNYAATRNAIDYLIKCGCKHIAYIGSKPMVDSEVTERERAYRDAMNDKQMEQTVINDVILHGEESGVVDRLFAMTSAGKKIDGVFASGYSMARTLCGEAAKRSIEIPQDLQVVAYDGSFDQWNTYRPLTCVEQPIEEMGKELVKLVISEIKGRKTERRVVFDTRFIVGGTTKNKR